MRKTRQFPLVLLLLALFVIQPLAADPLQDTQSPPFSITISSAIDNGIIKLCSPDYFYVVIANSSHKDQRLWKQSNSWGYSMLSFIVTDNKNNKYLIEIKPRSWRKNYPGFLTIRSGENQVYSISFTEKGWTFPSQLCELKKYTIQAILTIPEDQYSAKYKVWTGQIKFAAYKVTRPD